MTTTPTTTGLATTKAPTNLVPFDKPAPNAKSIMDVMQAMADKLASVATKHLTPEKLVKMIGVQMQRVPKLGNCTPISVLDCAMTCAELGLAPGILGDAYLIPYGNVCTIIIGYRGLLKLARRSQQISTVQAEVVREGDEFHWRLGMDAALEHVPLADATAKMTHAWAMCKFKDGSVQFVVLRATEVDAIRKRSKASSNGPWVTDTAEMWKKTALRRLCKMLPLTSEVEIAIDTADRTEFKFEDLGMLPAPVDQPSASSIASEVEAQTRKLTEGAEGDRPPTEEEESRRAAVVRAASGCRADLPGCSPEISTGPNGKPCCLNHLPEPTAGESLPGMAEPEPATNRPRKK